MEAKRTIEIPSQVNIAIDKSRVSVSGPKGQIKRDLYYPGIQIEKTEASIVINASKARRDQLAMMGTFESHIKNMIRGVLEGYEYKMKILYSHFPIQLKVDKTEVLISNFLGEKKPRRAKILGETKVEIDRDIVIVRGISKEDVGQTAANIEQATRIKGFDPRVFQDGVYIVERSSKQA